MLSDHERKFLLTRRVGYLATADGRAIPHVVPVCFTISQGTLYITIDEKPKRVADPYALGRVRDLLARPQVTVLVDHWDEDWARLAWLRVDGIARLLEPGDNSAVAERDAAISALRAKYPQYSGHDLQSRPLIRFDLGHVVGWSSSDHGASGAGS